jgi:uncharacterized protein YkwD
MRMCSSLNNSQGSLASKIVALATAAALMGVAGCGGGGGSDSAAASSTAPPVVTTPQDPGAPTLTNNIPADGLAWINYRRAQIGVQTLTRNSFIDRAAQSHSDYQKTNNLVSHDELASKPGFTGVNVGKRLESAGYVFNVSGYAGEVISATSSSSGFFMAEELITAIYHRFAIFEPRFRDIGTGSATTTQKYTYFTSDFATGAGTGGLGRGAMVTWPASSQTLVPTNFMSDNETPDPVSGVNEVGYPVSVHADIGSIITVDSFTLRARGASADVSTRLLRHSDDEHTPESAAAIVPLTVLKAGTTYDVTFKGRVDTVAANRTWSFTTR